MASELKLSFEFDRYVNGTLMAEGVTIERASTLDKAMIVAARIAPKGPNGETPVLVYRPAPAATDTGLVTIGGINLASGEMISCKDFDDGNPLHIPCCRKDRADELLAAKDQLILSLNLVVDNFKSRANALKSENEARDARIKELEKYFAKCISNETFLEQDARRVRQIEALEAKLAAAEKALEPLADIADLIDAETEGMAETDELVLHFHDYEFAKWPVSFFREARAARGGKPS